MMKMQSDQIYELAAALSKAQAKIKTAKKDSDNPFFHSKYADLAAVWDACREALAENGLAVVQAMNVDSMGTTLVTTLMHASGQWIRAVYPILAMPKSVKCSECKSRDDEDNHTLAQVDGMNDPQVVAKSFTYARRKSLEGITGVAPADDDDDGELAAGRGNVKPVSKAKPTPTKNMPAWRKDAMFLKAVIDAAKTVKAVNEAITEAKDLLKTIKADNKDAYDFLMDRATKREAMLAQEPPTENNIG